MDEEVDLWIAVIRQALWDATLGACEEGRGRRKEYIDPISSNGFAKRDIRSAREFIRGDDGALKDICLTIGLDYPEVRDMLITKHNDCQKKIPEMFREYIA